MAKGRVAKIVRQRDCLCEVFVKAKRPGDRAGDLSDLKSVGKPGSKMVFFRVNKYLGLVLQPSKSLRMQNPIPIPLTASPNRVGRLRALAPPRFDSLRRPRLQPLALPLFLPLS